MALDFPSLLALVTSSVLTLFVSVHFAQRRAEQQLHIAKSGSSADGRIVGIWRPPLTGSFPRLYFEYTPADSARTVRCCHVDRRSIADLHASLPSVGSIVKVRYLPGKPDRAVIARLVRQAF